MEVNYIRIDITLDEQAWTFYLCKDQDIDGVMEASEERFDTPGKAFDAAVKFCLDRGLTLEYLPMGVVYVSHVRDNIVQAAERFRRVHPSPDHPSRYTS